MTTFIHIGLRKTGTTFLESSMRHCRAELARYGVIYPDTAAGLGVAGHAGHHFVPHAIANRRTRFTPKADFSLLQAHVAAMKAEIATGTTGVISSEAFSTYSSPKNVRQVRELFPEPDVKIIVYLRRQDAWIDSLYGQMIKVGRKVSVEKFIAKEAKHLDFEVLVGKWAEKFGQENVIVRTYDGTRLWQDFMTTIGHPEASEIHLPAESANDSLPLQLALFARNIPNYHNDRQMRRVLESLSEHFPSPPGLKYLSSERGAEILAEHAASNARVARAYCGRDALFVDATPLPFAGQDRLTMEQFAAIQGAVSVKLLERIAALELETRRHEPTASWLERTIRKLRR